MYLTKEIKVGNYIMLLSDPLEVIEVEEIDGRNQQISGNGLDNLEVNQMAPIPLTKEWLLKLGFKPTSDCTYFHDLSRALLQIEEINGSLECDWLIYEEDMDHPLITLSYVHELQNACHVLTGRHLTIEEE